MKRRDLILAVPQAVIPQPRGDQWDELQVVWNPFAEKMNRGVLDAKLWKRVVAQVDRIEGRKCR